jgi:hypothetical protein
MSDQFFKDVSWFHQKFGGDGLSDQDIVDRFAVQGMEQRISTLKQIRDDQTESDDLRRTARNAKVARQLNSVHQALLKVGR